MLYLLGWNNLFIQSQFEDNICTSRLHIYLGLKVNQVIELTFLFYRGRVLCAGIKCASSTRRLAELKYMGHNGKRADYITAHTQFVSKDARTLAGNHWQLVITAFAHLNRIVCLQKHVWGYSNPPVPLFLNVAVTSLSFVGLHKVIDQKL